MLEKRVVVPHAQNSTHVTLLAALRSRAGELACASVAAGARARRSGRREDDRAVSGARHRDTCRDRGPWVPAASTARLRTPGDPGARRAGVRGASLRHRGVAWLRLRGRPLHPRLLHLQARPGRERHAHHQHRELGHAQLDAARRDLQGGGAAASASARRGAGDRAHGLRRRAGVRRGPVRHPPREPRRRRGARARCRRRDPHRHRRLSLVHGLGARHDDQPRGADARHRATHRGGVHLAHLRSLREGRPHPQHVPRREQRGALSHGRRHLGGSSTRFTVTSR